MGDTAHALLDVGLVAFTAFANALILLLLLRVLAGHRSIAKLAGALLVVIIMTAGAVLLNGRFPGLPLWAVAAGTFVIGLPSLFYSCGITWRQAALVSLALVLTGGTVRHLVNSTADQMLPGRWTIERQLILTMKSVEKPASLADTNHAVTVTDGPAKFFNAANEILSPDEARRLVQRMDLGLAQLRATNELEIAKGYEQCDELHTDLLVATGKFDARDADGKINFAELRGALAELSGRLTDESDNELNAATARLWQTMTSSNGVRSLAMLSGALGSVATELAASRTNNSVPAVAMQNAATLAQSIAGTFGTGGAGTNAAATLAATTSNTMLRLFAEAAIRRQQIIQDYLQSDAFLASQLTDKVPKNFVGPLPRDSYREFFVGPFLESGARSLTATDAVTVATVTPKPPRIVHETPPGELKIQAVMQKPGGLGYALCNDRIIPIGETISVEERNGKLSVWKLDSITNNRCLWSRVRFDTTPAAINVN